MKRKVIFILLLILTIFAFSAWHLLPKIYAIGGPPASRIKIWCALGILNCNSGAVLDVGPYQISGNVFIDENGNSKKDPGENNYSGPISIQSTGGTVQTASNGMYQINGLSGGNYIVSYDSLPTGYGMVYPRNGPPPSYTVTVGNACSVDTTTDASCVVSSSPTPSPKTPTKQIIINIHPIWSTTKVALTTKEVVDRFQVLHYARGQYQTYVPTYKTAGYQGLSLQYMLGEAIAGPRSDTNDLYSLAVGQKTLCTSTQKAYDPAENTVTMDKGAFCQLHDAIFNRTSLDHDLNSATPNQIPTENIFLHKANGDRVVPLTGQYKEHYIFNPANTFIQQYFAARLLRELKGGKNLDGTDHPATNPDGFELDNISLSIGTLVTEFGTLKEYSTSTAYVSAVHQFVTTLRTTLDTNGYSNRPLWGNMIRDNNTGSTWDQFADVLGGGLAENFALSWGTSHMSVTAAENQMTQAAKWISSGHFFAAMAQGNATNFSTWAPYSLANFLMITDGEHAAYRYFNRAVGYDDYYEFPELYYNLGNPIETRRKIASSPVVYERNFECGTVKSDLTNGIGTITQTACKTASSTQTVKHLAKPPKQSSLLSKITTFLSNIFTKKAYSQAVAPTTITIPIATSSDDAEEQPLNTIQLNSNPLALGRNTIGLRFTNIPIPKDSTILNAYITFTSSIGGKQAFDTTIRTQAADNAPAFTDALRNISQRSLNSSQTSWTVPMLFDQQIYRTPEIAKELQLVVNRPGWQSGNAAIFVLSRSGGGEIQSAYSFDGGESLKVAKLIISYTPSIPLSLPPPDVNNPGNIINLNFAINNIAPWMQAVGLDIRLDKGITNPIPPNPANSCGGAYTIVENASTAPGILYQGDSNSVFGNGQASATNRIVGGATYTETYSRPASGTTKTAYGYVEKIAQQAGITPAALPCSANNCTLPANLANGVYRINSDLTLNSYSFPPGRNYVFLINGTLYLQGSLDVPSGSTTMFSAKRDIVIDQRVGIIPACPPTPQLEGFFSADRNIIIDGNNNCTAGTDLMLNIQGAIVTNAAFLGGRLINNRTLCGNNANFPTFTISARPDFILNTPDFLKQQSYLFKEVAP